LSIAIHSAVTPTKRAYTKGMIVGFDIYHSGPVTVDLFRGDAQVPERAAVAFVDRVPGWKIDVPLSGNAAAFGPYRVLLQRSPSTAAFGAVIIGVLIALAGVAAFVAIQTARGKRSPQPPITTWYAAMLFAVMPLRNAFPDAPPIKSWIDVTVTLWVIVVLVLSMLVYVAAWWRYLRPEAEKPA
jgi:Domain of unknown function (DUF4436)